MIRALLDQGLPRSSIALLRSAGWDAVHVGELGMATASDAAILEHAAADQRWIVTTRTFTVCSPPPVRPLRPSYVFARKASPRKRW